MQSELSTPFSPRTGGEVDVQQRGGRHSHFLIMYLCVLEKGVPLKSRVGGGGGWVDGFKCQNNALVEHSTTFLDSRH